MAETDRRALVTGGNRGIGKAIAHGLVEQRLEVVIGARDGSSGRRAAAEIGADSVVLDVAEPASIRAAVESVGGIDILVNNAGVMPPGRLLDNPDGFAEALAVMVTGPYLLSRAALPHMADQGYGRIINVSSGLGSFATGIGGPGGYGVAKAALNALTVAVAREAPPGVKVNAMCPGWVRTRMGGSNARRSPDHGADTALWLATLDDDGPQGGFFRDRRPIDW